MTYGGYGNGPSDPFGGDPFGGTPSGGQGYGSGAPSYGPQNVGYPGASPGYPGGGPHPGGGLGTLPPPPQGEVNTLSTLSIVFAIVFAPVGAVLGHVALHQIHQRNERGRERALIGLTLSYVIIVAAIIALIVWLLSGHGSDSTATGTSTATTTTSAKPLPPPPPRTTIITAPPTERPTVRVEELRVGDCVEVQQNAPVPGEPNTSSIYIYRTPCQVRDGVENVDSIVANENACPGLMLRNLTRTIFACVSDFKG
jgi:hypothetical protein